MNDDRHQGPEARDPGAAGPASGAPERTPAPPAHQPPPKGADFMNALRWVLFGGLLLLAAVSLGSYLVSMRSRGAPTRQEQQARYYCPMHPSYTSSQPGDCPICSMSLEPIPDSHATHAAQGHGGDVPGLTAVHLSPERIQLIGVRTAVAKQRPLGTELDLVGFVTSDETRLRRVQIRVSGWVQQLHVSRTGEPVAAGQPLLSIYSPELYQSEQEFLIELSARDTSGHEHGATHAARERLRLLGVPEEEIRRLEAERTPTTRLTLGSPVTGTVLERGVTEGQYVGADTPLLLVADLSRVWVLADLYEMDLALARVGDAARFTADALPGRSFESRVDFLYPTVSSQTRTVKARLALANPGGLLRPGMYGRVRLRGRGTPGLAVPSEAVVQTGEHDYVFLARTGGHFEPRLVETGIQDGDWVQIPRGLAEGDTVVASASFLIDSESRLKAAIAGMGRPGNGSEAPPPGHQH